MQERLNTLMATLKSSLDNEAYSNLCLSHVILTEILPNALRKDRDNHFGFPKNEQFIAIPYTNMQPTQNRFQNPRITLVMTALAFIGHGFGAKTIESFIMALFASAEEAIAQNTNGKSALTINNTSAGTSFRLLVRGVTYSDGGEITLSNAIRIENVVDQPQKIKFVKFIRNEVINAIKNSINPANDPQLASIWIKSFFTLKNADQWNAYSTQVITAALVDMMSSVLMTFTGTPLNQSSFSKKILQTSINHRGELGRIIAKHKMDCCNFQSRIHSFPPSYFKAFMEDISLNPIEHFLRRWAICTWKCMGLEDLGTDGWNAYMQNFSMLMDLGSFFSGVSVYDTVVGIRNFFIWLDKTYAVKIPHTHVRYFNASVNQYEVADTPEGSAAEDPVANFENLMNIIIKNTDEDLTNQCIQFVELHNKHIIISYIESKYQEMRGLLAWENDELKKKEISNAILQFINVSKDFLRVSENFSVCQWEANREFTNTVERCKANFENTIAKLQLKLKNFCEPYNEEHLLGKLIAELNLVADIAQIKNE
ncbi:MAG: hypothetical protein LBI69_02925 [Puniceicoccales bacterium]|jgi:hypothetical protein|nr:hypothetical protein [Puniceicoccales bacterium]